MKVFVKLFTSLNLGDDLFLKILLERYPETQFLLPAPKKYNEVFKHHKNLSVFEDFLFINKGLLQKIWHRLLINLMPSLYRKKVQFDFNTFFNDKFNDVESYISIGGSIFMQPKNLSVYYDIEYYKYINNYFKNIFFIGCNFGPYKDPSYKESYKQIFQQATDVSFREKFSYEIFSDLNNVRYSPDIVFGLNYKENKKIKKSVGFSIITARNKTNKENYINKYAKLIEFYQDKGYQVFLFSFCKRQGDEEVINNITDLLNNKKNINKVFYDGDIDSFLNLYSSVEKMYCGRFHAMILSMLFNQKIYPIVYSKKMTNVLNDINYVGKVILMEEFYKILPEEIYKEIESNQYDIENQRKKSVEHFQKIDSFLNKIR